MEDTFNKAISIPQETINRYRLYQPLLRLWKYKQREELTISIISEYLGLSPEDIINDLQFCKQWDSVSFSIPDPDLLIDCIDKLLGEKDFKEVVLIGLGRLGTSLLKNETIAGSKLRIVAAFEIDPDKIGKILYGIKVQSMDKLPQFVRQMHLKMAMIATTPENAHIAVQQAKQSGLTAIWNFTQTQIPPIEGCIVQNTMSAIDIEHDYAMIIKSI